jgi:hypothetical protein
MHKSNLLTCLSLRTLPSPNDPIEPANYLVVFMIADFAVTYLFLSSCTLKQYPGLNQNCAPPEDVTKYEEIMVKEGKIKKERLDVVKWMEATHAIALENFLLFVGG